MFWQPLFMLFFCKFSSNNGLHFTLSAVLGMMLNRKHWGDVLAMLPGAGCFQHAPQHLLACWRTFLVTTCNWKTLSSSFSFSFWPLWNDLPSYPVQFLKELVMWLLNTLENVLRNRNTLRHPSAWFIDVLDSRYLVTTQLHWNFSYL